MSGLMEGLARDGQSRPRLPGEEKSSFQMAESPPRKSLPSEEERDTVLDQFRDWTDLPMLVLAFVWLLLLVIELIRGLTPALEIMVTVVWVLFVLVFGVELALAPRKSVYLRNNWLTLISLFIPAVRIFRIARVIRLFRLARAIRGLRLVKVVGSLNRAMGSIKKTFGRFGAGYVAAMSIVVTFVGAAGMYAFERSISDGRGLVSYGDALWWTAMIMTTLGSQYWPQTAEGRILGFLLSLYAFGVFGYVTGALASFFIGRDRLTAPDPGVEELKQLRRDIKVLQEELEKARRGIPSTQSPPPYPPNQEESNVNNCS